MMDSYFDKREDATQQSLAEAIAPEGAPDVRAVSEEATIARLKNYEAETALEEQQAAVEREARQTGAPAPDPGLDGIDQHDIPATQPHPARGAVVQGWTQAQAIAHQAVALQQQAAQLRVAGRANEAAHLLAQSIELRDQALGLGQQVQAAAAVIEQQEQVAAANEYQARLAIENRKLQRELGAQWTPQLKLQIAEYGLRQGYTVAQLEQVTAKDVLMLGRAAGLIGDKRGAPDDVRRKLRPHSAQNDLEARFVNRELRPGSLESAAAQLSTGRRLSKARQEQLWSKRVTQPKAAPGRPSAQQSEAAIAARLRAIGVA